MEEEEEKQRDSLVGSEEKGPHPPLVTYFRTSYFLYYYDVLITAT